MWLLLFTFMAIPVTYFLNYGITSPQFTIYLTTLVSVLLGFAATRVTCSIYPVFLRQNTTRLREKLAERIAILMLAVMLAAAFMALIAIRDMGDDYRALFFTEQSQIFGSERFGFFLQIFTEYGALVFFSVVLTHNNDLKWRVYLLLWATLGTVITLGRWYILYALLLVVLTKASNMQRHSLARLLVNVIGGVSILIGGALIFVCRGGACSFDLELIQHGIVAGIGNYLYIPIEMVPEYQENSDFGINLLVGFAVYPIELFGRITGLYGLDYEYDKWGLLIQNYVNLKNLGFYNALVGQPLTSFVAAGYVGIFVHYLCIGALSGICYYKSNSHHPIAVLSIVIATVSFFIPSLSGPMLVTSMIFLVIFRKLLVKFSIPRNVIIAKPILR